MSKVGRTGTEALYPCYCSTELKSSTVMIQYKVGSTGTEELNPCYCSTELKSSTGTDTV
jgi:hypothetical protein